MYTIYFLISKQIFNIGKDNLCRFVVANTKLWIEKVRCIEKDYLYLFQMQEILEQSCSVETEHRDQAH